MNKNDRMKVWGNNLGCQTNSEGNEKFVITGNIQEERTFEEYSDRQQIQEWKNIRQK